MNQISWKQFLTVTVFCIVIYYIVIVSLYYRQEIKAFLFKKQKAVSPASDERLVPEKEIPELVQDAIEAVKKIIQQGTYTRSPKEEIVFALQHLLGSSLYTTVKQSPFQPAINELIANECLTYCSIHLSEDDYVQLWNNQ